MMRCPYCNTTFFSLLPTGKCPSCGKKLNEEKELKPCPFCGAEAHVSISETEYIKPKYMGYVECDNMDCEAMIDTQWYDNEQEAREVAINRWNRRANNEWRKENYR